MKRLHVPDEESDTRKVESKWGAIFAYGVMGSLFLLALTPFVSAFM